MSTNPLLNTNKCYHGTDIWRLESILKNGILSQNQLKQNGIPVNYLGYNGSDRVSVALYKGGNKLGGAYGNGITLVCNPKNGIIKDKKKGTDFEAFVEKAINPNEIEGIIMPLSLFEKPIKEADINMLLSSGPFLKKNLDFAFKWMNDECGYSSDFNYTDLIGKEKNLPDISDREKFKSEFNCKILNELQKAIDKKLGKENSTFADYVKEVAPDKPLYVKEDLIREATLGLTFNSLVQKAK